MELWRGVGGFFKLIVVMCVSMFCCLVEFAFVHLCVYVCCGSCWCW